MGNSAISLPSGASGARAKSLTLRIERDLCHESVRELVTAVSHLIERSTDEVVLEIGDVNTVDSGGLRALLTSQAICDEAGIRFRLIITSDHVDRILRSSGLSHILGLPEPAHEAQSRQERCLGTVVWTTCEHVEVSNPDLVSVLRGKINSAAEAAGADGDALCDIQIAAGEALANAYRHGSPRKGVSQIDVRCMSCSEAFIVEVQDEGAAFDPDATPEPDPHTLQDHGMGIYLMRRAMDVVEFSSKPSGNRVRMVKWLSPEDMPPASI